METKEKQSDYIEIYKIHVDLSDRVSARRGQTNIFFVTVNSVVISLYASLHIEGSYTNSFSQLTIGVLGILLCLIWYFHIRSYRQLNRGKFKALHELEEKLSYPFFKREWEHLSKGEDSSVYFQLSKVEQYTPIILMIPYLVLIYIYFFF